MNELHEKMIVAACKTVITQFDAVLVAEQQHLDWVKNDEEWGLGNIRVRYDWKEGQLAEAIADRRHEFYQSLSRLKTVLLEVPHQTCPKCGSGNLMTEFKEFDTAAGDYVNEYEISLCYNPACDFKQEKCIGGHCSDAWNLDE